MPPPDEKHAFRLACLGIPERHSHAYKPIDIAPQRCSCASRTWKVTCGGPLPPAVTCANCGGQNRVATAYERGRDDARTTATTATTF